jgi:hypothetical protein
VITKREYLIFVLAVLVAAFVITRGLAAAPGFTDAFYHFNAARQIASGQGFTDHYLWTYIGAPDSLPAPSHLYWMPLTSLAAALGMGLLNAPGDFAAAQWPFMLMLAGTGCTGFWLGARLGRTRRHAWLAGILTLFGGFFMRFWGTTDTFAPYALVGSLCLVFMGLAVDGGRAVKGYYRRLILVGALAGLGHLARADGALLLFAAWTALVWPFYRSSSQRQREFSFPQRVAGVLVVTAVYLLVMLPWFMRNLNVLGSLLPVGGAQGVWFTEYNDFFNYPPDASPQHLFANGPGLFLQSRWEAFTGNLGTLIAVEGMVVLAPLMLIALWKRRAEPFLRGFWLYALGLHIAMTLIFPFPGVRGGLFHSAAALLPWWMALGVVGLDDVIDWIAQRRRHWNRQVAKRIFSAALLAFGIFLSLSVSLPRRFSADTPALYAVLMERLPPDARVMINDPAQLYYYTGIGGVVLPSEASDVIPEIARKYAIDYVVLESQMVNGQTVMAASDQLASILDAPPDFLSEIEIELPGVRLYAINP